MTFGGYSSENFGTFFDYAETVLLDGDGSTCTGPMTPLPFYNDQNIGLVDSNGNILSCGGQFSSDRGHCIVYNKETDTWEDGPNMRYPRGAGGKAARLSDGRYFIIGATGSDPA